MKEKGLALVVVLVCVAVFSVLGVMLHRIIMLDKRIGHHMALYDQLYYYAEAGVEAAVAGLPRDPAAFSEYQCVIEQEGVPSFKVEVLPLADGKLIKSRGMGEGKSRVIEVVAKICLFGENVLFSCGDIRLDAVEVVGNVRGTDIVFMLGESTVKGKILHAGDVKTAAGGSYRLTGRECATDVTGDVLFDFDLLEEKAGEEWYVAEGEKRFEWGELDRGDYGKIFVPGDLVISEFLEFDGIIIARGKVELRCAGTDARVVILAEEDIVFAGGGGLFQEYKGITVLYSGGDIKDRREGIKPRLKMSGVLMARGDIELVNFSLNYNEELLSEHGDVFAQVDFAQFSSFLLEWQDVLSRR